MLPRLVYLPSGPRNFIISSHNTSPVRNHSYKSVDDDVDDDDDDDWSSAAEDVLSWTEVEVVW